MPPSLTTTLGQVASSAIDPFQSAKTSSRPSGIGAITKQAADMPHDDRGRRNGARQIDDIGELWVIEPASKLSQAPRAA